MSRYARYCDTSNDVTTVTRKKTKEVFMTSEKQLIANQKNSIISCGPKSIEGKAIVSNNARKHGLLSQNLFIPEEQKKFFNELRAAYIKELSPQSEVEGFIVERIISCIWRLHLLALIEKEKYEKGLSEMFGDNNLSESFRGAAADNMTTLSRYERSIENSLYRAIKELRMLKYTTVKDVEFVI